MTQNNKKKYIEFCQTNNKNISIFHKDWWLDSVCGEHNWDVSLVKEENKLIAAIPYYSIKKYGFKILIQPPFTQKLGIMFFENESYLSYLKKPKEYKEIVFQLIDQLPKFDYFNQFFFSEIKNWLPFFWKGFNQQTFYSHKILDIKNKEILNLFSKGKKKDLKKSQQKFKVEYNNISAFDFYEHHKASLKEKKQEIFYSYNKFNKLYDGIFLNNSGFILSAVDKETNKIAALLLTVYDKNDSYSLITSIKDEYKAYAPLTLLFYNSILESKKFSQNYDFEGGMDSNLGDSFRHLGGTPIQYFNIKKNNSFILQLAILFINYFKINKLKIIK